jgi:hypothetical protein
MYRGLYNQAINPLGGGASPATGGMRSGGVTPSLAAASGV